MLSERLGTTLTEAQAELDALKPTLDTAKAALDQTCRAAKAELDAVYKRKKKHLGALVRALESETPPPPDPPTDKTPGTPAK